MTGTLLEEAETPGNLETVLVFDRNRGILPNLMDSLKMYENCLAIERGKWEREFGYWHGIMNA